MQRKCGQYIVEITNSKKVLFPGEGITKIELINYYERIASTMLPHIQDRAVVMHRYPNGINKEGFFHKDIPDYFPQWIDSITIKKTQDGSTTYAIVNNEASLIYLANYGCITPHVWLSRVSKLENPDMMIFDLDPDKQDFKFICVVARKLKKLLSQVDLIPFVKTSGSKGLHVVVPLDQKNDFNAVRKIARCFAQKVVEDDPKNITLEISIKKRKGRLFIDITRNAFGQTIAAPYAVRPKLGAPIATPIEWHELSKLSTSQHYTIKNIFRRVSQKEDPWKNMYKHACSLSRAKSTFDLE